MIKRALSESFGVSRIPIREGFQILATAGMVKIIPRQGGQATTITREGMEEINTLRANLVGLVAKFGSEKYHRNRYLSLSLPGRSQKSNAYHQQLILALKRHDGKRAEEIVRKRVRRKNLERKEKMVSFNPLVLTLNAPEDGRPHLLGNRCNSCGSVFFPQQHLCTACFQEGTMRECALSIKGKLYSYTIVERESLAPPGFSVPYAYGYVELPEGIRVLSKIIGWTPETLKIDAQVEMVLDPLREDSSGQKVMGFRFRMVQSA